MGVYQKGKHWYIDYYVKGVRKRKKVGPNKKLAEQALMDVQVKIAKGEFLGVYEDRKITFSDFGKEYLEFAKANKSPSTYHRRDCVSVDHLTASFGRRFLFEITPQMIEKYKATRLQAVIKKTGLTVTPTTVNKELGCLKHMYSMAIKWGYVKRNPVKEVKLFKQPPGRLRYLESDEAERLIKACLEPYLRSIVITALNTGMRKGEILGLTWDQIDLTNRRITLLKTKNNELRVIPINDRLYLDLVGLPRHPQSGYVFCDREGRPFGDIKKGWAGAVTRAKIRDFRFHDLRHTVGSQLVMKGVDLRTVQQILGHKEIKMTMRYSHLSPGHVQDAMQKLGSVWSPYGHQAKKSSSKNSHKSLINKACARSSVG